MRLSDKASVGGALLGLTAVVGGLLLEGGTISQILQPTAALIVFGGTAGAVLIQFPLAIVLRALRKLREIFSEPAEGLGPVMELLLRLANTARRHGIVSLDAELDSLEDPFLRKVLMLAVDCTEPAELRKIADLELNNLDEREARDLYESFHVAGSGIALAQMGNANINPWTQAKANTKNPERGPLLIIEGERDHTVPWAIAHAAYKRQRRNPGVTQIMKMPNRGHSLTIDHGWREVAQTAFDFVKRFVPAKPS
jgi:pimeloyl-ACP methyl ester carboxylesterase